MIYSSKNPANLSMTLKNFIPFILLFNFGQGVVDEASLNGLIESIVNVIVAGGTLITGLLAMYGFFRKISLTFFSK